MFCLYVKKSSRELEKDNNFYIFDNEAFNFSSEFEDCSSAPFENYKELLPLSHKFHQEYNVT